MKTGYITYVGNADIVSSEMELPENAVRGSNGHDGENEYQIYKVKGTDNYFAIKI